MSTVWGWNLHKYREPESTDDFVRKQGIVYVFCDNHWSTGSNYLRYLLVGYFWFDDPDKLVLTTVNKYFRDVEKKIVKSRCPICRIITGEP